MPPRPTRASPSQSQASLSLSGYASGPAVARSVGPVEARDTLLPRLATHLVAAKRSLTSIALVQRADALVSTARKSIEDIASLSARNAYLRDYATRELRILQRIRNKLDDVRDKGSTEFKAVLRTLDASDERVKRTLHLLKTTPVEASFQPPQPESTSNQDAHSANVSPRGSIQLSADDPEKTAAAVAAETEQTNTSNEKQKCLYDFVSEQGVDDLTRVFRECIDATNAAASEFSTSMDEFDSSLQSISSFLRPSVPPSTLPDPTSPPTTQQNPPDEQLRGDPNSRNINNANSTSPNNIPALFRALESNATEVADLLQSLVRHYDLCVTALKHTEGGGEAAAEAHARAEIDIPNDLPDLAKAENVHEPLSEQELAEMIEVLDKDAHEVDDVVRDIQDHESEMEEQLDAIFSQAAALKTDHARLRKAVRSLEEQGSKLTLYISAGSAFMDRWAEQKNKIEGKMEELDSLRDFYEGFLNAYDGLILEIGRRKIVHAKMDKILSDAMAKVSKLRDQDAQERENFRVEQGEFLPSDIWPGLVDPPAKFEVRQVDVDTNHLPEVSKEAMQRAMQRHGKRL